MLYVVLIIFSYYQHNIEQNIIPLFKKISNRGLENFHYRRDSSRIKASYERCSRNMRSNIQYIYLEPILWGFKVFPTLRNTVRKQYSMWLSLTNLIQNCSDEFYVAKYFAVIFPLSNDNWTILCRYHANLTTAN